MQEELESLLGADNFAQLATVNDDGSPHIDTVWFSYRDNQISVATTTATKKANNLLHNPNAYIVVTDKTNAYRQAQIKVRLAAIVPDDDLAICDAIAQRYIGKPFPQRHHRGRVALIFDIIKARYHQARV